MEEYTKRTLKQNWDDEDTVSHRAKRGEGTSAPDKAEIRVYRNFFKKSVGNKKNLKVLILGATPELRDLTIKLGAKTIAVDISERFTIASTDVMKFKDSPLNKTIIDDWLNMNNIFPKESFDVIIADASLNNIPLDQYDKILHICNVLLKKGGYFIVRQLVYDPSVKLQSYDVLIKRFNEGKTSCLGFLAEMGMYSDVKKDFMDRKNKKIYWGPVSRRIMESFKNKIDKTKWSDLKNLCCTATSIEHSIFTREEFESYFKKYFSVKKISGKGDTILFRDFPIYMLEKK